MMNKTILITGGAGFIGSALIRYLIAETEHKIINIDKLTYAGDLNSLNEVCKNSRYTFIEADICDSFTIEKIFNQFKPNILMHLAAESHVDRSINSSSEFIQTNIIGTYTLLEAARNYYSNLKNKEMFRFHHISTDEVYGDLPHPDFNEGNLPLFKETTPYNPSSPYSASKASSDHLVKAWYRTYKLPILITNCSNNYGPFQYPEKLIPLVISNALNKKEIPIYGKGEQIRDWLYVDDHVKALYTVAINGSVGETYNIGGHNEMRNIDVVNIICSILNELVPCEYDYRSLIRHVEDRAGHDLRYAIDASKIKKELGWNPEETFETGIKKTVQWNLNNSAWLNIIKQKL